MAFGFIFMYCSQFISTVLEAGMSKTLVDSLSGEDVLLLVHSLQSFCVSLR